MKSFQSKRKFYNKWLYKVTIKLGNPNIFRHNSVESISNNLKVHKETRNLAKLLSDIKDFQLRIETKFIDVYINEKDHFDQLIDRFEKSIKHCFSPHPDLESESINPKDIIANKLPFDRYRYKVFIKAHAIRDSHQKYNYLKWLETQHPRILITESTKDWFIKTSWNWDRRYMYIEDEQTLLMAKMRQCEVLGSVYTYKVSINS
jgi:hypothetical protein